jgi:MFS family permease
VPFFIESDSMQLSNYTKITPLLISLTTMMSNVAIITVIPHLEEIFNDVGNIELLSRLMITLPSLVIAILAPILGHAIHRYGKKRSAILALIIFALSGTAGLYLDSIESLLLSRALLGIGIAALMIISTSLVGDYFQGQQRHKFMGLQSAFVSIGGVVFVVSGGFLSDIDWRYPFGIYFIGAVLLPFALLNIKEIPHSSQDSEQSLESVPPKLLPIYFLAFLLMSIFYILPTQVPFLMMNVFGASGALTGSIISTAFVFHALGALSFAKLKGKLPFHKIYILGMLIISCGFLLISLIDTIYLFFFSAMILGFGGGMTMTNMNGWMLHLAHQSKRVKSSGYLTSSFFLGQFFSPILTMPFVIFFGVQDAFFVIGALIFSIAGFTLWYKR